MKLFTDINGKALLYAIPLFLTPFSEKLGDYFFKGLWPSWPHVVGCSIIGIIAAAIGLRAFFDGSYQRAKDEKDQTSTNP